MGRSEDRPDAGTIKRKLLRIYFFCFTKHGLGNLDIKLYNKTGKKHLEIMTGLEMTSLNHNLLHQTFFD